MMRFSVFDRWGAQTGVLKDVVSAVHKDELNGEDSLTLVLASCDLAKGDRIVWRDKWGAYHEHTVNDVKDVHENGALLSQVYCENSISELLLDYIVDLRPYDVSATVALQRALSVTRWGVGSVDVPGSSSASFYHMSARAAITEIVKNWGGEWSTTIAVADDHVSARSVNITTRGQDNGKRFEWRKDISTVSRTVSSNDVFTALYGYGKGVKAVDDSGQETGGYGRRLTFGEINGGLDYVADETARLTWGHPDGNGGKKHSFGKVEFTDCDDMERLLALTTAELQKVKQPRVSYAASVVDLGDLGYDFEDVRTGDVVSIIDREMGVRVQGRVIRVERDLFNENATVVTLGNMAQTIATAMAKQKDDTDGLIRREPEIAADIAAADQKAQNAAGAAQTAQNTADGVASDLAAYETTANAAIAAADGAARAADAEAKKATKAISDAETAMGVQSGKFAETLGTVKTNATNANSNANRAVGVIDAIETQLGKTDQTVAAALKTTSDYASDANTKLAGITGTVKQSIDAVDAKATNAGTAAATANGNIVKIIDGLNTTEANLQRAMANAASGPNMLLDTDVNTMQAVNADYPRSRDTREGVTVDFATMQNPPIDAKYAHRWQITAAAATGWMAYVFYNRNSTEGWQHGVKLTKGEKYTISCWVYGNYANRAKGRLRIASTADGYESALTMLSASFDVKAGWNYVSAFAECTETRIYRAAFDVNPQGVDADIRMCGFSLAAGVPSGEYDTLIRETTDGVEVGKVDETGAYVAPHSLLGTDGFHVIGANGTTDYGFFTANGARVGLASGYHLDTDGSAVGMYSGSTLLGIWNGTAVQLGKNNGPRVIAGTYGSSAGVHLVGYANGADVVNAFVSSSLMQLGRADRQHMLANADGMFLMDPTPTGGSDSTGAGGNGLAYFTSDAVRIGTRKANAFSAYVTADAFQIRQTTYEGGTYSYNTFTTIGAETMRIGRAASGCYNVLVDGSANGAGVFLRKYLTPYASLTVDDEDNQDGSKSMLVLGKSGSARTVVRNGSISFVDGNDVSLGVWTGSSMRIGRENNAHIVLGTYNGTAGIHLLGYMNSEIENMTISSSAVVLGRLDRRHAVADSNGFFVYPPQTNGQENDPQAAFTGDGSYLYGTGGWYTLMNSSGMQIAKVASGSTTVYTQIGATTARIGAESAYHVTVTGSGNSAGIAMMGYESNAAVQLAKMVNGSVTLGRMDSNHMVADSNGVYWYDGSGSDTQANALGYLTPTAMRIGKYAVDSHFVHVTGDGLFMRQGYQTSGGSLSYRTFAAFTQTAVRIGREASGQFNVLAGTVDDTAGVFIRKNTTVYSSMTDSAVTLGRTSQPHTVVNSDGVFLYSATPTGGDSYAPSGNALAYFTSTAARVGSLSGNSIAISGSGLEIYDGTTSWSYIGKSETRIGPVTLNNADQPNLFLGTLSSVQGLYLRSGTDVLAKVTGSAIQLGMEGTSSSPLNNVTIDANGIKLRRRTTTIASFAQNAITLGSSDSSVVSFNGSRGTVQYMSGTSALLFRGVGGAAVFANGNVDLFAGDSGASGSIGAMANGSISLASVDFSYDGGGPGSGAALATPGRMSIAQTKGSTAIKAVTEIAASRSTRSSSSDDWTLAKEAKITIDPANTNAISIKDGSTEGALADWVVEEYVIPESGAGTTSHTIGGYVRKWASGMQEGLRVWEGTRTINTSYDGFYVSTNTSYTVVPSSYAYQTLKSVSFSISPVDGAGVYWMECTGINSNGYQATARITTTPAGKAASGDNKYFRIEQRTFGTWK